MRIQIAFPSFHFMIRILIVALVSVALWPLTGTQMSSLPAMPFSNEATGLAQAALQTAEYEVVVLTAPAPLTDSEGKGVAFGQAVGTGRIPDSVYPDETHAVLWPAGTTTGVDLHPADFRYSAVFDTNGQQQVGRGNGPPTNFEQHAVLWTDSAASYVDLHPDGIWNDSVARATAGDQQVGNLNFYYQGQDSSPFSLVHAALWHGTADNVVDLHPTIRDILQSYGTNTDGSHQVGYGFFASDSDPYRALLWSGTPSSAVVLHPRDFTHSFAEGVSGDEQVGYGFNALEGDGYARALLWHGSANSFVNLQPADYLTTSAYATNGTFQVGSGSTPDSGQSHALRWAGSPESLMDLHLLLPAEFSEGGSIAYDIDAAGNIIGLAQRPDGSTSAVLWRSMSDTPLPTPTPIVTATPTPIDTTDFALSAGPELLSVQQLGTASYEIVVSSLNAFSGTIQLSLSGGPKRTSYSLSTKQLSLSAGGSATAILNVKPQRRAPVGTFLLTIKASGAGITHSETIAILISGP
jgi:hypothetical protein